MEQNIPRQVARTHSGLTSQGPGPSPHMTLAPYQVHHGQYPPQVQPPHHAGYPNVSLPQTQTYRPHDNMRHPITTAPSVSSYASPTHFAPHTPVQNLPPTSAYSQASQNYQPSHTLLPNTTASAPPYQSIAPAPPRLPNLHPIHSPNGLPDARLHAWASTGPGMPNPQEQPKHVVGSQGRRGILPSAPGRPAAVPNGANGSARNATIPAKNADGKFPCPNCNKTYLHAKHLKRHMLRHTGDRPYTCVLCQDTFSRSDILKRHFAKCSIRRGNPTGLTHLAHPQAHTKKNTSNNTTPTNMKPTTNGTAPPLLETDGSNSLVNGTFDPDSTGAIPSSLTGPGFIGGNQAPYFTDPGSGLSSNHAPYPPSRPVLPNQWPNSQSLKQEAFPNPSSPITPTHYHSNSPHHMTTHPQPQSLSSTARQTSNLESWAFQQPTNGYEMISSLAPSHNPIAAQQNPLNPQQQSMPGDLFLTTASFSDTSLPLYFDPSQPDPIQTKAHQMVEFCFPSDDVTERSQNGRAGLAALLSGENMKHFLEQYSHFHGHWPVLHMPTFNFSQADDGLVLVIACIGAVYSDHLPPLQVRALLHQTKSTIQQTSSVWKLMKQDPNAGTASDPIISDLCGRELEEVQALVLLQVLSTWHGDPVERAATRADCLVFRRIAKRYGLFVPAEGPRASVLHQRHCNRIPSAQDFDWRAWVEQEKKSRVMFMFFLVDAAMAIYFNCPPQFEVSEIQLPLPVDDVAWEAKNEKECATMMGLNGHTSRRAIAGTGQPKQWEVVVVFSRLLNSPQDVPPNSTNVYSKFILIHALLVQIWRAQRSLSTGSAMTGLDTISDPSAAFNTPVSLNGWFGDGGSGASSRDTSGRATPIDTHLPGALHPMLQAIRNALSKWKKNWDEDMQLQYPQNHVLHRRFGFCRDGVHFYYLARALLGPSRAQDWTAPPDTRFMQLMTMLKSVRTWAATEAEQNGTDLGSVGDIDPAFGMQDLTLDMKDLFKPTNARLDTPISGLPTGL